MMNEQESNNPRTTETASNDTVISTLNGLIETCKDGQEGFRLASEAIDRSELKTVFSEFSLQRAEFAGVLQQLVRNLGGDPEKDGSVTGSLHRGWINIKTAVTGADEESILNECERGEDYAKDAYKDALEESLPANVSDVLRQQAHAILAAHNRIKTLRDSEDQSSAASGT